MSTKISVPLALAGLTAAFYLISPPKITPAPREPGKVTQGTLLALTRDGQPQAECPLKHTAVTAEISGFLARVNVVQEFENTASDTIEAKAK